jgi:hypothetical protein
MNDLESAKELLAPPDDGWFHRLHAFLRGVRG